MSSKHILEAYPCLRGFTIVFQVGDMTCCTVVDLEEAKKLRNQLNDLIGDDDGS